MNSTLIQHWQFSYLCVASLVAVAAVVAVDHLRAPDPPDLPARWVAASIAGVLWPVMIVGLVQFWSISTVVDRARPAATATRPAPRSPMPVGSH